MDTPPPEHRGPVHEIASHPPKAAHRANLAKFSIIAAVVVVLLNLAQLTVFENRPSALTPVQVAAVVAVVAGALAASGGLFLGWFRRDTSAIILAAAGLLLNGGLFATGFVKAPVLGKRQAQPIKHQVVSSAEPDTPPPSLSAAPPIVTDTPQLESAPVPPAPATESGTRPASSSTGPRVITEDWTAGFIAHLTDATFDDYISDRTRPVLVDFWAPWCGPCRKMGPVIEQLAADFEGKAKICKLNVDEEPETADRFRVTGIPTIILFQNGRVHKKWVGVTSRSAIMLEINKLLE